MDECKPLLYGVEAVIKIIDLGFAFDDESYMASGRGLHSSTLQLNLGAFCVTGGAARDCFGGV